MTGALTEEQLALREVVRSLLSRHSDMAATRLAAASAQGYDPPVWRRMCEQVGVAALAVPPSYGGFGAGMLEVQIVLEELGRTLTPSPMFGSAVLAAQALLCSGDEQACGRWLPAIASGEVLAALAWPGPDGGWDPDRAGCTAVGDGTMWRLHGEAHYVIDGDLADVLVVVARHGDATELFEVDPDQFEVERQCSPTMDFTRRMATVRLAGAVGRLLGPGGARPALRRLRDIGCVALAAEQVGAAARALELTVEYTSTRVQFGRPIGGFQTLKHRMADLHVLVETARSAAHAAAVAVDRGEDLMVPAAVAKVHCSETLTKVAGEMVQLHGGIAITWEHDAHLYLKRAHATAQLFGRPGEYVTRLAEAVGL